MRCRCNDSGPRFSDNAMSGWRSARRRCSVCGKFYHIEWECAAPKEPCLKCDPPPAAKGEGSPEIHSELLVENECESPIEDACGLECCDDSPLETESSAGESGEEHEIDCCAVPWVFDQVCPQSARKETLTTEIASGDIAAVARELPEELPDSSH